MPLRTVSAEPTTEQASIAEAYADESGGELFLVNANIPEYAASARRVLGEEQGNAWADQVAAMSPRMARMFIQPEWVGVLDFETRFPSAIERWSVPRQVPDHDPRVR